MLQKAELSSKVHEEGKNGSTRRELDSWIKTLPQPRMIAMEATIFTGWIYDHLLPSGDVSKQELRCLAGNLRKACFFSVNY